MLLARRGLIRALGTPEGNGRPKEEAASAFLHLPFPGGGLTAHCSRPPESMAFIVEYDAHMEGCARSVGG
jgi:hypothetical protein